MSALVPYKRLDVAIEACRRLAVPLNIVGTGPEEARLRALAGPGRPVPRLAVGRGDPRRFTGRRRRRCCPEPRISGSCRSRRRRAARPVVALDDGGAPETVVDGQTGVLVPEPTAEAFAAGLSRAMQASFDPAVSRANALRFSKRQFVTQSRRL